MIVDNVKRTWVNYGWRGRGGGDQRVRGKDLL